MDDLEYITSNALIMCDQGGCPDYFQATYNKTAKIQDLLVATNMDGAPIVNIPSFKICKVTRGPCTPGTAPETWNDTWPVRVLNSETLIGMSTCKCTVGGTVEFMTSGQIPLPPDALAELQELQTQAQRELDNAGYGNSVGETGFVEGMIPVWGSGRDLINSVQTGNVGGALLNGGFLIWDGLSIAAGVVSFGAGTALMQGAKAGVKGTVKAAAKAISKEALQQLGKSAFKSLSKEALKKSTDDLAKKLLKTCVFACFPAGTPVHTEQGLRNIEEIQPGDRVWSYNNRTGETALQDVVEVQQNESDHTITLYTAEGEIETTAPHPFYVNGEWKTASELEPGDKVFTRDNRELEILETKFSYIPKKVYNFEVAGWHTYFVGLLMLLVHNADKCISEISKRLQYLGRTPGKASKTGQEVFDRMVKDGTARINRGQKEFWDAGNGVWRNIREADMGHVTDAVKWWNDTGRFLGAKSPEVRKWMLDSKNYALEYFRTNRSNGAKLLTEYLPPVK